MLRQNSCGWMDDGGGGGRKKDMSACVCIIICTPCKNVCYYFSVAGIFQNSTPMTSPLPSMPLSSAALPAQFTSVFLPPCSASTPALCLAIKGPPGASSSAAPLPAFTCSLRALRPAVAAISATLLPSGGGFSAVQVACEGDWCCCRSWLYHKC